MWDSLDTDDIILRDSRDLIHVDHGLTVIHHSNQGTGFFNFGQRHGDMTILNTMINSFHILDKFILFFYGNTKNLFKEAEMHRITIDYTFNSHSEKNKKHL